MRIYCGTAHPAALQHGPRPLPLFLDMLRSETAASPERASAALAGLRRYQEAPRGKPRARAPARFRKRRARLRDYGGAGRPVVFVPSLINPPFVLDLTPETSLLRWIAGAGFHAWLVDWGVTDPQDRALDVAGHVSQVLEPLLAKLPEPPLLVGYCLGGTMAMAAASRMRVAGLATIAAPWRFAGYGAAADDIAALWRIAEPACRTLGLVPVEVLQSGFWRLDPARTIRKFEAFATMAEERAAMFVALEDWANAGEPLTYAAGAELFEAMVMEDQPGAGRWRVGGEIVGPGKLDCPAIEFVSLSDRIVPAATAAGLAARRDIGAGHVGMIVGSGARRQLWEPLRDWLRDPRGR
ncbi:alpha/beta fold hydrolase [uncultured Sphingomonas sp.]|uniref:alpha/beta fold hydrolase n=1 Tax=uncultured Sphingomonas sp. TaxID=158754 RepID=UPI00260D42B8|nr:alpha/beta fold hydrolase [uncultured Sphingomonas sp.]